MFATRNSVAGATPRASCCWCCEAKLQHLEGTAWQPINCPLRRCLWPKLPKQKCDLSIPNAPPPVILLGSSRWKMIRTSAVSWLGFSKTTWIASSGDIGFANGIFKLRSWWAGEPGSFERFCILWVIREVIGPRNSNLLGSRLKCFVAACQWDVPCIAITPRMKVSAVQVIAILAIAGVFTLIKVKNVKTVSALRCIESVCFSKRWSLKLHKLWKTETQACTSLINDQRLGDHIVCPALDQWISLH